MDMDIAKLRERFAQSPLLAARADQIEQILRGKEPLRHGLAVEVERATGKRLAPSGAEYHIRIRASTNNIARDAGIVPMSAWERGGLKNFNANPVILAYHNHREPIGRSVHTELEAAAMNQYWEFHQESEVSRMMKTLYEKGFMRAASVGFLVHEFQFIDEMGKDEYNELAKQYGADALRDVYWIAKRAELLETSAVPVPSDPHALTFDFAARNARAAGLDISELARIAERPTERSAEMPTPNPEVRSEAAPAAPAPTPDPIAELRTFIAGEFNALREENKQLLARLTALEARGTTPSTPAEGSTTETPTEERSADSEVTIDIEVRDGETEEQALARHVDETVRKVRGAPIPSTNR